MEGKSIYSEIVKLEDFSFQKDIRSDCSWEPGSEWELMESRDA